MGVYIKGMEMPKSCRECGCEQGGFWCGLMDEHKDTTCFTDERRDDCPLIPVPDHGRLIDADALEDDNITYYAVPVAYVETETMIQKIEMVIRLSAIDNAPTIIPADKEMI